MHITLKFGNSNPASLAVWPRRLSARACGQRVAGPLSRQGSKGKRLSFQEYSAAAAVSDLADTSPPVPLPVQGGIATTRQIRMNAAAAHGPASRKLALVMLGDCMLGRVSRAKIFDLACQSPLLRPPKPRSEDTPPCCTARITDPSSLIAVNAHAGGGRLAERAAGAAGAGVG